jgi:hypothetical protein
MSHAQQKVLDPSGQCGELKNASSTAFYEWSDRCTVEKRGTLGPASHNKRATSYMPYVRSIDVFIRSACCTTCPVRHLISGMINLTNHVRSAISETV